MAQMTNLLIKDDAATPKEWTLVPLTDTPNPIWRSIDPSIPIEGQIRLQFMETKLKNGQYKITAKLEVPVMETLGASGTSAGYIAPPKVAYVTTAIFTIFADRRSTSQDRSNTLRLILGIIQGASSVSGTGTLANTAAGQAFLLNANPGPQLFSNLVLPN